MIDPIFDVFVNSVTTAVTIICGRKKVMLVVYIGSLFLAFMMVSTFGKPESVKYCHGYTNIIIIIVLSAPKSRYYGSSLHKELHVHYYIYTEVQSQ